MAWARMHGYVVLTQDLDFPQILFESRAGSPSVVLLRIARELDAHVRSRVRSELERFADALRSGALVIIDEQRVRLRTLPIEAE
ncbi:MAG: DUF5615 family PIN-like protein [Verrucomicrobiales bacterium]